MRPANGVSSSPKREPQHLRARELLGVVLPERFGCGLQVDLVERDPSSGGVHERSCFLRQTCDVGRGELDVIEQRRPTNVRELVSADRCLRHAVDSEAQ